MQTAYGNEMRLPARYMPLDGGEMVYLSGGAGVSLTLPIPGLLPPQLRAQNISITVTFSWDGKGLIADFPQLSTQLSKIFPISLNFKFT